ILLVVSLIDRRLNSMETGVRRVGLGDTRAAFETTDDAIGRLGTALGELSGRFASLSANVEEDRSRLLAALNSSAEGIVALDSQNRLAFVNSAAEQLLGRGSDALEGNSLIWVLPNADLERALRSAGQEGQPARLLLEGPRRQSLEVSALPIVG